VFLVNGLAVASWISRIADVHADLGVRDATFGLVLGAMSAGVIGGLLVAGRVAPRTGSRTITLGGAVLGVTALPLAGLVPGPLLLATVLLLAGAGISAMDVGMNAQGVGVERGYGRSIMIGLHAAWSVGSLLGALGGAWAVATRTPVAVHLGLVVVVVAVVTGVAARWLRIVDRSERREPTRFAWPRGALFPLALVAFAAALGESAGADWSGIHLRETLGVVPERTAWGYVSLTAAMTVVRLLGDRVARRFGPSRVIVAGGWAAGLGFLALATIPNVVVALVGFALIGGGLGVVVPLAFSAAGRVASSPGAGVAAVATMGYTAFLVGPPLIGLVNDLAGLPAAYAMVGVVVLALTVRRLPDAVHDHD
jgi:MFS family permease